MVMISYSIAINNCPDNQTTLLAVEMRTNSPWLLFRFILDLNTTSTVDSFLKPNGSAGRKKNRYLDGLVLAICFLNVK